MNWTRLKVPPSDLGERPHGQRLGEAGHALEQDVTAGQQRDEHALEHRVLADDDALALPQGRLQGAARLVGDAALGVRLGGEEGSDRGDVVGVHDRDARQRRVMPP